MFSQIEIPHFVTSGGLLRLARKSEGGRTLAFLEKRTALRHYAELQKSMYNYTLVMTRKVKKKSLSHDVNCPQRCVFWWPKHYTRFVFKHLLGLVYKFTVFKDHPKILYFYRKPRFQSSLGLASDFVD